MWKSINNYLKVHIKEYGMMWASIIIGVIVGMGIFSIFVQAPKGLENWLSAIGTILAVITSLFLSLKPRRVKMAWENNLTIYDSLVAGPKFFSFELSGFNSSDGADALKDVSIYYKGKSIITRDIQLTIKPYTLCKVEKIVSNSMESEEILSINNKSELYLILNMYSGKQYKEKVNVVVQWIKPYQYEGVVEYLLGRNNQE